MRTFEITLIIVCIASLLRPFLRTIYRRFWIGFLLALLALTATLHFTLEGYRWQMIPAYFLAGLIFASTLPSLFRPDEKPTKPGLLAKILSGLGLFFLAIAVTLPALFPIFKFPKPTGPYQIGTVTYHWTDSLRDEPFTEDPSDHRELMVQIWYPTDSISGVKPAPYTAHPEIVGRTLAQRFGLPAFVFDHLRYIHTNAFPEAAIALSESRYPVILFSHGVGGLRMQNTFQVEALVSHGYIVAGIEHTYAAAVTVFPDGRVVPFDSRLNEKSFLDSKIAVFAADASFVLDQLESLNIDDPAGRFQGRIELDHVGIFGHSLGGIVAAQACMLDPRFAAGMNIDAFVPQEVVESGLVQPFMFITRDAATMEQELAGQSPEKRQALIDEQMDSIHALFNKLASESYLIEIHGLYHFNATDLTLWTPLTATIGLAGPIDAARAHEIVVAYTLAFFDKHLKGQSTPLLENSSPLYPEVGFTNTNQ